MKPPINIEPVKLSREELLKGVELICKCLYQKRFRFNEEIGLQLAIAEELKYQEIRFVREVRLSPKDRIDFMCGPIGIEVKIFGSTSDVTRQLWRYAQLPQIDAMILVTTRSVHRDVPAEILEKPVFIVHLLNSIF